MWLCHAIAVLSAGALGYEILLMRLFSIVQWHHFAYMIISVALLGYGASGTVLALTQHWLLPRFAVAFMSAAVLFGLTAVGSFALAQHVPFNPLEVIWDPRQWGYLLVLYLLLCVPFLCAATGIGLALARMRAHVGRIYQADLLGAGSGALGMLLALCLWSPTACLTLLGSVGFVAAALAGLDRTAAQPWWLLLTLLLCSLALPGLWPQAWMTLRMSEYKGLSQALRVPEAEILSERSSPLGVLTVVHSPTIPFRYAPDLSLTSVAEPPPQLGLFTDGESLSVITRYDGRREPLVYLDALPTALPYHLLERPSVLILGAGGGTEVLQAHYHQARAIDAVELNPHVVDLVQRVHAEFAGHLYSAPDVRLHVSEARGFVAASREQYDLIQVAFFDSLSASAAGVYALNESYLYTVEALQTYFRHLRSGGLLSMTRWLKLPPRDSLKLYATALTALERSGVRHPERQLALVHGWQTITLLVKHGAFTPHDLTTLRTFCATRSFDVAYDPGMPAIPTHREHMSEGASLFEDVMALVSPDRAAFLRRYKYDIRPATDDRPYFFHFFKWRVLPEILALRRQGGSALLEWGYLLLIAALLQATVVSVVLIVLPLWRLRHQTATPGQQSRIGVYFAALGLAFLFMEIAFMQRFMLFLSHPLYATAIVLCAFLVFAGLGSGYAAHITRRARPTQHHGRPIALAVAGIIGVAVLDLALLELLVQLGLGWPAAAKMTLTLVLIVPLAFCMGLPFPLGLACVASYRPAVLPWAWGINGCASVLSAILATVLAIHYGFTVVVGLALGLYILAAAVLYRSLDHAPMEEA
jgi:predicted membrane-bound spermidine synthase